MSCPVSTRSCPSLLLACSPPAARGHWLGPQSLPRGWQPPWEPCSCHIPAEAPPWAIRMPSTLVSSSVTSNPRHICLRPWVLASGSLETQFRMSLISQEATKPIAGGSQSWKGSLWIRVWGTGMSQGAVEPKGLVVCATVSQSESGVLSVSGIEGFFLKNLLTWSHTPRGGGGAGK